MPKKIHPSHSAWATLPEVAVNAGSEESLRELELKINISLRLLCRFASLHRRWPANGTYVELIQGLENHLEYWEVKRRELKDRLRLGIGAA